MIKFLLYKLSRMRKFKPVLFSKLTNEEKSILAKRLYGRMKCTYITTEQAIKGMKKAASIGFKIGDLLK